MYKAIVKRVEDLEEKKKIYGSENEKIEDDLEKVNEKALKDIRRLKAEINKCLDEAEAKLVSKLQKLTQENTKTQTKIKKTLQALSSELEEVKQMTDAQLHRENALFINAVNSKIKVHAIEKMLENKEQEGLLKSFVFVLNEHMSGLLQSAEPLGKLEIDAMKKKMKPKQFVVGVRVRRGPDWKWDKQDGGGPGTLIGFRADGWATVEWDNGHTNSYRIGQQNAYDIEII